MATLSKTQVDQLGDRLRRGIHAEVDLRALDEYRRSFGETYATVVETIRQRLHLDPTGRPAKSTSSLLAKLRRESIRLTQVQDVAGCRVVVADAAEQELVVASLSALFSDTSVIDRRANPSHGYRAVHAVVRISGRLIEIQIRTPLQHLWAEFCEKLSDKFDSSIKYGGGTDVVRNLLAAASDVVAGLEEAEMRVVDMIARLRREGAPEQLERKLIEAREVRAKLDEAKLALGDSFREAISTVEGVTGENP